MLSGLGKRLPTMFNDSYGTSTRSCIRYNSGRIPTRLPQTVVLGLYYCLRNGRRPVLCKINSRGCFDRRRQRRTMMNELKITVTTLIQPVVARTIRRYDKLAEVNVQQPKIFLSISKEAVMRNGCTTHSSYARTTTSSNRRQPGFEPTMVGLPQPPSPS